jgi:iron transport multicopper oxidase
VLHAGLPNSGPFDEKTDVLDATVIRDTITVNGNSSLVLRYVANNPGIWFMHCHIGEPHVLQLSRCNNEYSFLL